MRIVIQAICSEPPGNNLAVNDDGSDVITLVQLRQGMTDTQANEFLEWTMTRGEIADLPDEGPDDGNGTDHFARAIPLTGVKNPHGADGLMWLTTGEVTGIKRAVGV